MGAAAGAMTGLAQTGLGMMGEQQAKKREAEAQAKAASHEAWNELILAHQSRIQAHETNTKMTTNLMNVVENIRAVRGSTGTETASPTGAAVVSRTLGQGNQDIRREVEDLQLEGEMHQAAFYWYMQVANSA
jgi:hypothetical protein